MHTAKPLEVISVLDPALDRERIDATTMMEYVRDRKMDIIKPFIKTGQKPTIFHVRRISRSVMLNHIMSATSDEERRARCFVYGIERVENLVSESGTVHSWKPTGTVRTPSGESSMVTDEELERFAICDISEIGDVIWHLSFLRPGCVRFFRVPRTSVDTLVDLDSLSVVASRNTQAQSNEKPKTSSEDCPQSKPTPTTNETGGDKSEPLTDASAAGNG